LHRLDRASFLAHKQKAYMSLSRFSPAVHDVILGISFLVLFSKKNGLLS